LANILPPYGGPTFHDVLQTAYETGHFPSEFLQMLQDGTGYFKKISLGEGEEWNERLHYYKKGFLSVNPLQGLHILQQYHDTSKLWYSGNAKTFEIIVREFILLGMQKDIVRYIRNYYTC
jgi:hypothetical protein